jgi:ATP-dependent exoDNAse (exonuclease V) beta subunit
MQPDVIYQYIKGLHEEKAYFENGRLLYVAATRAKQRLHLLGHVALDEEDRPKMPPKRSLLASLWPAVKEEFEVAALSLKKDCPTEEGKSPVHLPASRLFSRLGTHWQCPEPMPGVKVGVWSMPEAASALDPIEFDWAGESARYIGTVVHRYLQIIAQEGLEHWNQARITALAPVLRRDLMGLGIAANKLDSALRRTQDVLNQIFADARGRWILSSNHQEARNEYPLSGILNGRIVRAVIDRTFVDQEGIRWIVDYKISTHEGGNVEEFLDREKERYRPQLESYAALMAMKEPEMTEIRLGLYYPQLCGWREWCWLK